MCVARLRWLSKIESSTYSNQSTEVLRARLFVLINKLSIFLLKMRKVKIH